MIGRGPARLFLSALFLGAGLPAAAASPAPPGGPPPIPPVLSATDLGAIVQNAVINGRDGTFSALIKGRSVWNFGDTALAVPGASGDHWVDNSLSWTSDLDASDGITLDHDYLDATGAPAEFVPHTPDEVQYNYEHDPDHCTASPCGAEVAIWPGQMVADPARRRVLVFFGEIWRVPGRDGWRNVGAGIAVVTPRGGITRPVQNPGSSTPTLMWGPDETPFTSESLVDGDTLYSYGCDAGFLVMHCKVARVPLAAALDRTRWEFYAGDGAWSADPAAAVPVFDGGAAGNSIAWNEYLGMYLAIYSGVFSDTLYYRVSYTPWGPWSEQAPLFTGRPGWNGTASYAGRAHPEYAQEGGRVQYVTYAHTTGFLQMDLPLVRVEFGAVGEGR